MSRWDGGQVVQLVARTRWAGCRQGKHSEQPAGGNGRGNRAGAKNNGQAIRGGTAKRVGQGCAGVWEAVPW